MQKISRIIWILVAVTLLMSFSILGLHHHEAGQDSDHCKICQSLRALAVFVIAFVGAWFFFALNAVKKIPDDLNLPSSFHPLANQYRAPPFAA